MEKYKIEKEVTVTQSYKKTETQKLGLHDFISQKVKYFRILNNMSQGELADKLKVSRQSVANIEAGRHKLSMERLEQLSKIFGVDSNQILPF